ncbi:NYN domain-containing protein [Inquilinus sp. Marseille-Q2685]|uniref:NYN domain-containing protein n=1 Tax=Inquilinus sp. Marseille-Q2685 TaxID=2866581 RepID=UPI001CE468FD|nr:NYN domain-containing protein [Inquilinus sp. Marseille-Q2685]
MTDEISPVLDTPALPVAAVFLDVASLPGDEPEDLARILGALGTVCRPARRIAYADWAALSDLRGVAHRHGFDQVQTTEIEPGRDAASLRLVVDAMELGLLERGIDTVVLVTGSAAFLPLVRSLRRHGKQVIAIGPARRMDPLFQSECDRFFDSAALGRPAPAPTRTEIRPAAAMPAAPALRPEPAPVQPRPAAEPAPRLRVRPPAEPARTTRLGPAAAEPPRPSAAARAHRPSLTAQFEEPEGAPAGPPLMAGTPVVPQRKGWFGKRR